MRDATAVPAPRRLVDFPSHCGLTPLHYAGVCVSSLDAASALLRHGADPNARCWQEGIDNLLQMEPGSTPLHSAARNHNLPFAMLLLKYWNTNLVRARVWARSSH